MNSEQRTMNKGKKAGGDFLYSLIPLDDFKALLGIDDREDKTARFCLVTATHSIEQYCKRRFLWKKHCETHKLWGDMFVLLNEFPVSEILTINLIGTDFFVEPDFYYVFPDCGTDLEIPTSIELSPALKQFGSKATKVNYCAGYSIGKVPKDLASACFELAAWNLGRYRGRQIGIANNGRGNSRDGQRFEMAMPENVKQLLVPYQRKTI
jgi:hypothetical protein